MSSKTKTILQDLFDAIPLLGTCVELDEDTELDLWRVMGFDRHLKQSTPFDSYEVFTQSVEITYREMAIQQNALGVYFPSVKRGMLFPKAGYANMLEILVNQDQSDFAYEFAKVVTGANQDPAVAAALVEIFERAD